MNHWILKTDSDTYPFEALERDGRTVWDGVANALALRHIRAMAAGDRAMVYHSGGDKAVATQKKQYFRRKKVCRFCVEKIDDINYKDVKLLHAFVAERGKIIPRRISGVCAPHQRRLTDSIKKARNIALLPFAASF